MPFFVNKFSPAKCPTRKKLPFHNTVHLEDSNDKIKIKLGDLECEFLQGKWKLVPLENSNLSLEDEHKELTILREENNFLKLKIEILLDMLTEETVKGERRKELAYAETPDIPYSLK